MKKKIKKFDFKIRPIKNSDRQWIRRFIAQEWASEKIISRGKVYYPHKLAGFIAFAGKKYLGLLTHDIKKDGCQIITLNSLVKKKGVGRALVEKVKKMAKNLGCQKMWLITTNDNLDALIFWQKIGFSIRAVYSNTISFSRKLKPELPFIGNYGIPIRDEIELEFKIKK